MKDKLRNVYCTLIHAFSSILQILLNISLLCQQIFSLLWTLFTWHGSSLTSLFLWDPRGPVPRVTGWFMIYKRVNSVGVENVEECRVDSKTHTRPTYREEFKSRETWPLRLNLQSNVSIGDLDWRHFSPLTRLSNNQRSWRMWAILAVTALCCCTFLRIRHGIDFLILPGCQILVDGHSARVSHRNNLFMRIRILTLCNS